MTSQRIEAMNLALAALGVSLTLPKKITPYKGQEDFLSDSIAIAQHAITALEEALEQTQEPVQTTPNFAQLKQILDNLDRCHHRDSKQEFLQTWIRDWTEHKLTKHTTPPQRKPLTDEEIDALELPPSGTATVRDLVRLIEAAHGIKEKSTCTP